MIYEKLLEFQKKGITLKRDGLNPHFKSQYVTLNEVLEKIKVPLNEAGILVIQSPGEVGTGEYGLFTNLIDTEDNSKITCFMPYVGATDSQKLGSANTYLRRYSLITLLGLEDEDDDGNTASTPKPPAKKVTNVQDVQGEPFPSKTVSEDESLATLEYN